MLQLQKINIQKTNAKSFIIWGLNLVVFTSAFLGTSIGINKINPESQIPVISDKFRKFATNKDEYNTLFIGSSRIYRHIIPNDFDKIMQSHGNKTKSFNFGVSAMRFAETYFILNKILELNPKNLQWIFMDYNWTLQVKLSNLKAEREVNWHTWKHTLWVYKLIVKSDLNTIKKIRLIRQNTIPLAYNITNIGRFKNLLKLLSAFEKNLHQDTGEIDPNYNNGYIALDHNEDPGAKKRRTDLLANIDLYRQKTHKFNQTISSSNRYISDVELSTLADLIRQLEAKGIKVIFVTHPLVKKDQVEQQLKLSTAHDIGTIPTLFSLDNPQKMPILFQENMRYDWGHLNHQGAQEYTRYLGKTFVEYLEKNQ